MDDLAVIADCEEEVIRKYNLWQERLERKGLRVKNYFDGWREWHYILRNEGKIDLFSINEIADWQNRLL